MKVIHIDPGAGGTFYCQNCMRDCALVHALRKQGQNIIMVPMYLPILIDSQEISGDVPVFFGGINVYLQQQFGIFRKTPRWLDKLFDTPWMLKQAAAREATTEASSLGPITLSMLKGEDGNQKKELARLVDWLVDHEKPDLIHISNALLLGLVGELKRALGVPVVCSLQDEQTWLVDMKGGYDQLCWDAMASHAEDVDAFISVSDWYAEETTRRMSIPPEKMHVVPLGIDLSDRESPPISFDPPVLGYLSKMTESLGLGLLVDAFISLKKNPELADLRLRVTGGQMGPDVAYVKELKKKLAAEGVDSDAEFLEGFEPDHRRDFMQTISVLSVPSPRGESFGMFIVEALAAGVPVVQPDTGGYPEVVEATGGGLIYDVNDPNGLADALESLLLDPDRARTMGQKGREVVNQQFGIDRMADDVVRIYEALV
jgi:glycosyltransferase involved in cell wall biosynthesis